MFRCVFLAATLVLSVPVSAQEVNLTEGLYSGSGEGDLTVDLEHIEDDRYAISINTVVPISDQFMGCAGGIEGEVLLSKRGGNFFVENEDYDPEGGPGLNERYCEIGVTFDGDGNLSLEERSGCLAYHGASCGFSGTLTHDAAGI